MLIELSGRDPEEAEATLHALLVNSIEDGLVTDAVVAQNGQQRASFWRLREEQTAAQRAEGASWSHDVSVPLSRIPAFLAAAEAALERSHPGARPIPFGHLGDGNIHYNVVQPEGADAAAFSAAAEDAARLLHDIVADFDG